MQQGNKGRPEGRDGGAHLDSRRSVRNRLPLCLGAGEAITELKAVGLSNGLALPPLLDGEHVVGRTGR